MKTKLQLYRSAEQAAEDSLSQKDTFAIASFAMDRFKAENLDARDWDFWNAVFGAQRQSFVQLVGQKSISKIDTQPTE